MRAMKPGSPAIRSLAAGVGSLVRIALPFAILAGATAREIRLTPVFVIQSETVMNTPEDIKIEGHRMFVSLRGSPREGDQRQRLQAGISAWDLQQIGAPKLLFHFSHPALQGGMDHVLSGRTLFLQSLYNATLLSLDLTEVSAPVLLGTLKLGGAQAVAYRLFEIRDQRRLVVSVRDEPTQPTGRIAVIDIADPRHLRVAVALTEPGAWSYDNHAVQNAVYSFPYKQGNGKLSIYELGRDDHFRLHGTLVDPLLDGVHCHEDNGHLFVANFNTASILVLDIRDRFAPRIVGRLQDHRLEKPTRIAPDRERNLLWVAGFGNTISVIDIANRQAPRFAGSFTHPQFDQVQTIAYYQDHLFVGSRNSHSTVILRVEVAEAARP